MTTNRLLLLLQQDAVCEVGHFTASKWAASEYRNQATSNRRSLSWTRRATRLRAGIPRTDTRAGAPIEPRAGARFLVVDCLWVCHRFAHGNPERLARLAYFIRECVEWHKEQGHPLLRSCLYRNLALHRAFFGGANQKAPQEKFGGCARLSSSSTKRVFLAIRSSSSRRSACSWRICSRPMRPPTHRNSNSPPRARGRFGNDQRKVLRVSPRASSKSMGPSNGFGRRGEI